MKKKSRILLCGIMTFVMALVMAMPVSVSAAELEAGDYATLQEQIDSAAEATTIRLTGPITGNITIPSEKDITIDLNGQTVTNTDGHTIVNNGKLTIIGSGTVDNVTHGRAALVNYGEAILAGGTFTRSAEASTGPTENGNNSYYVIDNNGSMTVREGTTIINDGYFSSLVRNMGTDADNVATLRIEGGTLEQQGFIAVKNDDYSSLSITGGTITSDEQAVQNWSSTEINGGTLNGPVITWAYGGSSSETRIISGNINGDVIAVNYDGNSVPEVIIEGGTITGELNKGTYGGEGIEISDPSAETASIIVTGGSFASAPTDFLSDGVVLIEYKAKDGAASIYHAGTEAQINEIVEDASSGDEITVLAGDVDLKVEGDGVKIKNNGDGAVTANGTTIKSGDEITTGGQNPSDSTESTTDQSAGSTAANDKAIATGDDTNLTLMFVIMGLAAAAAAGTVVYGRRKRSS